MAMQVTARGRKAYMNDYEKANFDALAQNAARDQQAREFAARAAQDAMRWEANYGKDLDMLGRNQQFTLDRDVANRDFTRERDAAQQAFQTEFRDTSLPYQQWNQGGQEAWAAELEDAQRARDLARTTQDRITAVTQAPTWSMFNPSQQADLIADIQAAMGDVGAIQGRAERSEQKARDEEMKQANERAQIMANVQEARRLAAENRQRALRLADTDPAAAQAALDEADRLTAQATLLFEMLGVPDVPDAKSSKAAPTAVPQLSEQFALEVARDEVMQVQPEDFGALYIKLREAYLQNPNQGILLEMAKVIKNLYKQQGADIPTSVAVAKASADTTTADKTTGDKAVRNSYLAGLFNPALMLPTALATVADESFR